MKKRILWTAAVTLYLLFVFHNSLTPADLSSQQSGAVLRFAAGLLETAGVPSGWLTEHLVRKTAHFAEYALFGVLLWNCLRTYELPRRVWTLLEAWLILAAPFVDETLQLFTEGRSGQISDVWLDMAGAAAGTLCALAAAGLLRTGRRRRASAGEKG